MFEGLDYTAVSRERTRLQRRIEKEPALSKGIAEIGAREGAKSFTYDISSISIPFTAVVKNAHL